MKQQKQHIIKALLVTAALLTLAGSGLLFADETTISLESKVVQDFSQPDAQNWFVLGSKFSTGDFPHLGYVRERRVVGFYHSFPDRYRHVFAR